MLFYQDAVLFQDEFSEQPLDFNEHEAVRIFETFIAANAPLEINLPYDVLEDLRNSKFRSSTTSEVSTSKSLGFGFSESITPKFQLQGEATEQLYERAANATLELMSQDTLKRFIRHRKYGPIWMIFVDGMTPTQKHIEMGK